MAAVNAAVAINSRQDLKEYLLSKLQLEGGNMDRAHVFKQQAEGEYGAVEQNGDYGTIEQDGDYDDAAKVMADQLFSRLSDTPKKARVQLWGLALSSLASFLGGLLRKRKG